MSRCCWRKPPRPSVSADRPQGAKAIEATEANVIVMDDGFQNPSLAKDLSLVVVDGGVGVGNGLAIPVFLYARRSTRRSRAPRRWSSSATRIGWRS